MAATSEESGDESKVANVIPVTFEEFILTYSEDDGIRRMKWDFVTNTASEGRVWIENMPPTLRSLVVTPFKPAELDEFVRKMKLDSPKTLPLVSEKPKAFIMIGAGGSGKSCLVPKLGSLFKDFLPENFVELDGDILRSVHGGFCAAVEDHKVGYKDCWTSIKPYVKKHKAHLLQRAAGEGRNLVIPTGVHAQHYYRTCLSAGYEVTIIGVYVTYEIALARGINRAEWSGRAYLGTRANWQVAVDDMWSLSQAETTSRAVILDNTDFSAPETLFFRAEGKDNLAAGAISKKQVENDRDVEDENCAPTDSEKANAASHCG